MELYQEYQGRVEDLTHEGKGVVKVDGYPLFIEKVLPGEEIRYQPTKLNKKYGFGQVLEILKESPDRVPVDKDHEENGAMPLQHLAYEKQLDFKENLVRQNLARIGGLEEVPVYPTIGMDQPLGYRNKVQVPVQLMNGQLETGIFKKGSHDLLPIEDSKIADPEIDKAVVKVRDILREHQIKAYNERDHVGDIRHILVRRGYYTGELMLVLITRREILPKEEEIVADILEGLPETVSIIQNINPKKTNVILGRDFKILYGEDVYRDRLLDFNFEISHQSFYQVNPTQTEKLYQIALDYADLDGDEVVLDAYCGIGTISLALSQNAQKVYGIEIVAPAIENAKRNAALNGVDNVEFFVGAAEKVLPKWAKEGRKIDVMVVDPPRKGLDQDFIQASLTLSPEKIVYVSCNPATLARDLKLYAENGYQVHKAQPVDLFPMTTHVECVVLMSRTDR